MAFTKLVVLSTLLYFGNSASVNSDMGYLLINGSRPNKDCYSLPNNTECPSNMINYKVFGLGFGDALSMTTLKSVDLMMKSLVFFKEVTQTCRDAVREYACSNSFASCVKDDSQIFGVAMTYNITRTEQACARVKATCPLDAQMATIHNCTTIMKNFKDLAYCVDIPNIPGDACPKSNYKHPKPNVDFYPTLMRQFNTTFTKLQPIFNIYPNSCKSKFLDINCQLLRGTICSSNMLMRMYTTTRQQCAMTMQNCLPSFIPNLQSYFVEMCKIFPDENTAKMVPLPQVAMGNEALSGSGR